MQKYPHITELFACTRKMLPFMILFSEAEDERQSVNSLISSGLPSAPKLLK